MLTIIAPIMKSKTKLYTPFTSVSDINEPREDYYKLKL